MRYREEAIECVKDHVLQIHKQYMPNIMEILTGSIQKGTTTSPIRVG